MNQKSKDAIQKALIDGTTLTMTFSTARPHTLRVETTYAHTVLHESRTVEEAAEDLVEIAAFVKEWA